VAGQALGYVAAPLEVYNFVENWQSGKTGSEALQGAEAGAAVGSIIPGVGTIVGAVIGGAIGAISSAFGPGAMDPENQSWDGYASAYQKNPNSVDQATPSQNFQALAGIFDARGSNIPFYGAYGRMGENKFTSDMLHNINNAVSTGKVAANSSAQQIYSQVVQPWITSMGGSNGWKDTNTVKGAPEKDAIGNLLTNLIAQWQAGGITSTTKLGIDGQPLQGGVPAWAGKPIIIPTATAQQTAAVKNGTTPSQYAPTPSGGVRQQITAPQVATTTLHPMPMSQGGVQAYAKGGEVLPIATLADMPAWEDDADTSAYKTLKGISDTGNEQAGVIFAHANGKFAASNTVTTKDHDNFGLRAHTPDGAKIAGIFHNHLGHNEDAANVFSPRDVAVANQLNVPSYVLFPDGSVRKYVPGKTKTRSLSAGHMDDGIVAFGDAVNQPQTISVNSAPTANVSDVNTAQLSKGGEVLEMYKKFQKLKGYADGGAVSDDSQPGANTAPSDSSTQGQPSALQSRVGALLGALGQDSGSASKVVSVLHALNPEASEEDLLKNLSTNLPSIITASMRAPKVTSTIDPNQQQNAQANVNAQRTAAAKQVQDNYQKFLPSTLYNMSGTGNINGGTVQAADAALSTPMIGINAAQQNVEAQGKARETDLDSLQKDFDSQRSKYAAQNEAALAQSSGYKATQDGINAFRTAQQNDPKSVYSMAMVTAARTILKDYGASADVVNSMNGKSALDAYQLANSWLDTNNKGAEGKERLGQAAVANQNAALTGLQVSLLKPYVDENSGNNTPQSGGSQPGSKPAQSGGQTNDVDGLPEKRQLPAQYSGYRPPAVNATEQSNIDFARNLNESSVDRQNAQHVIDEMIGSVEGMGGPTGYSPRVQDLIKLIDPQRQVYDKLRNQLIASSGGGTNQQQGFVAGGLPDFRTFTSKNDLLKQLRIAKGKLMKADKLNDALQERGRSGDFVNAQPQNTYAGTKSFAFLDPVSGKTLGQSAYGPSRKEQLQMAQDIMNAKKKGLRIVQTDE
jgi:Domain of unknown function (DUF4329)